MIRAGWRRLLLPWAGLAIGLACAGVVHQFGSESSFDHCATAAPWPILAVALAGLIVCAAAGFASWRSHGAEHDALRIVAAISVGCAAFFAFAILIPIVALSMLPPCFG